MVEVKQLKPLVSNKYFIWIEIALGKFVVRQKNRKYYNTNRIIYPKL